MTAKTRKQKNRVDEMNKAIKAGVIARENLAAAIRDNTLTPQERHQLEAQRQALQLDVRAITPQKTESVKATSKETQK